jgi:hypothetical protein
MLATTHLYHHSQQDMCEHLVLCPSDQEEAIGMGVAPEDAFLHSLNTSSRAWTIRYDRRVVGGFGVAPMGQGGVYSIWLLHDGSIKKFRKQFLREAKRHISDFLKNPEIEMLTNFVSAANASAIRMIKALGAKVLDTCDPVPGPFGGLYYPFYILNPKKR